MAMVEVDGSVWIVAAYRRAGGLTAQVGWFGLRVGCNRMNTRNGSAMTTAPKRSKGF